MVARDFVPVTVVFALAIAALGFFAGLLIGCIGVGGVIIVPALVQVGGFPVYTAIAVAMAGYILTGLIGTWAYIRSGTLDRRLAPALCLGAAPAAVAGSVVARTTPSYVLELIIGAMTLASGLHALLRRSPNPTHCRTSFPPTTGLGLGAAAGFVSALTGTGGPACLIPLLLWMDVAVLTTVGLAQAIQLPIAGLATITNLVNGAIDLKLGLVLGGGLVAGTWIGAKVAHGLNQSVLQRLVCLTLIAVGLLMLGKALRDVLPIGLSQPA